MTPRKSVAAASKAERLEAQVVELQGKRDALIQKVAHLAFAEDQAREQAFRDDPGKRPSAAGLFAETVKLAKERDTAEREIGAIEKDLRAAAVVLAELRETRDDSAMDSLRRKAAELDTKESEAIAALGEAFSQLMSGPWAAYCDVIQARIDTANTTPLSDQGDIDEVRRIFSPALQPVPLNLPAMLDVIHEVAVDPANKGYRDFQTKLSRAFDVMHVRGDAAGLNRLVPDLSASARFAPRYSGSTPFVSTDVKAETAEPKTPADRFVRTEDGGLRPVVPSAHAITTVPASRPVGWAD